MLCLEVDTSLLLALGKKLRLTQGKKNVHNISLGQGQETVAEKAMDLAAKEGHWVVLQVRGGRVDITGV